MMKQADILENISIYAFIFTIYEFKMIFAILLLLFMNDSQNMYMCVL